MLFWALIFTKAGKQWCNGPMEQANLRTQVFIYHTLFALEHRSKMTTQPGTGTQTILTLHKPDLQHTGLNTCSFKKFFLPEYNPSSPQPWHPLPVYQLLPCREPWSRQKHTVGFIIWTDFTSQATLHAISLWGGNKPHLIYTSLHLPFKHDTLSSHQEQAGRLSELAAQLRKEFCPPPPACTMASLCKSHIQ